MRHFVDTRTILKIVRQCYPSRQPYPVLALFCLLLRGHITRTPTVRRVATLSGPRQFCSQFCSTPSSGGQQSPISRSTEIQFKPLITTELGSLPPTPPSSFLFFLYRHITSSSHPTATAATFLSPPSPHPARPYLGYHSTASTRNGSVFFQFKILSLNFLRVTTASGDFYGSDRIVERFSLFLCESTTRYRFYLVYFFSLFLSPPLLYSPSTSPPSALAFFNRAQRDARGKLRGTNGPSILTFSWSSSSAVTVGRIRAITLTSSSSHSFEGLAMKVAFANVIQEFARQE